MKIKLCTHSKYAISTLKFSKIPIIHTRNHAAINFSLIKLTKVFPLAEIHSRIYLLKEDYFKYFHFIGIMHWANLWVAFKVSGWIAAFRCVYDKCWTSLLVKVIRDFQDLLQI